MVGLPYIVEGPIGTNATPTTTFAHTHAVVDITGLQAALDGKQASGSYAPTSHTHSISEVTSLQATLTAFAIALG